MVIDTTQFIAIGKDVWKWGTYLFTGLILGGISYLIALYINRRHRFNYIVRIHELGNDSRPIEIGNDKGGIFLDRKTQNRLFLLKKNRVGLSPDNVPYIETPRGIKIVNVLRLGLKNYRYLNRPLITVNSPIALEYGVQDYDVAWGVNTIEQAKMFKKQTLLQQLMPFIGMTLVFMLIVISLWYIFKNVSVLKDVAVAFQEAANAFAQAKSGTTIIPGGG